MGEARGASEKAESSAAATRREMEELIGAALAKLMRRLDGVDQGMAKLMKMVEEQNAGEDEDE